MLQKKIAASFRQLLRAAILAAAATVVACSKGSAPGAQPKPEVVVQTAENSNVPLALTYTARTAGSLEVEVRARVGGILQQRRYIEGSAVRAGEVLFEIDSEPYRAMVAQARGELAVEKAGLEQARLNRERIVPLYDKKAVSQRQRDEAVSAFESASARVMSAEARLKTAELDLSYTEVRAPISGLTSREMRSQGSLVQAGTDSSLLTRMVKVDPLYIEFSLPDDEAAMLREQLANPAAKKVGVTLLLASGEYPQSATLTFVDTAVDTSSGTVLARAVLPNKKGTLVPGQFVRVRLTDVELANVVSIPRKAVMMSPQGSFVWVIDGQDTANFRPVQMGKTIDEQVVITTGLAAGERYITEGVMKVRPGVAVSPVAPVRKAAVQGAPAAASKEAA